MHTPLTEHASQKTQLKLMDAALFRVESMGLRERLLATPLAQRFELSRKQRKLFINFEGLSIDSAEIEVRLSALLQPLGERVAVRQLHGAAGSGRRLCRHGEAPQRRLLQPRHALRHGWFFKSAAGSGEGIALLDAGAGIFLRPAPRQWGLA